jgi:uncharacterized DUF497 family protein
MHFEYDPMKSQSNKEKHGIDFEEVQRMWDGAVKEIPAVHRGEPRWFAFGEIDGKVWVALITRRNDTIRIFSARRANKRERWKLYE